MDSCLLAARRQQHLDLLQWSKCNESRYSDQMRKSTYKVGFFIWKGRGIRKGGTSPQTGAKIESWRAFFSTWENPLLYRRTPCGCGYGVILPDNRNPIMILRPKIKGLLLQSFYFCLYWRIRISKYDCPVDSCLLAARRQQHLDLLQWSKCNESRYSVQIRKSTYKVGFFIWIVWGFE